MSVVCACITGYPQNHICFLKWPMGLARFLFIAGILPLPAAVISELLSVAVLPHLTRCWVSIGSGPEFLAFLPQAHHQYRRCPQVPRPDPFLNSHTPSPILSNPSPLVAEKGRTSFVCVTSKPRGSASASPRAVHMQLSPVALLSAMNEPDSVNGTH
jgi:hypothetical protein